MSKESNSLQRLFFKLHLISLSLILTTGLFFLRELSQGEIAGQITQNQTVNVSLFFGLGGQFRIFGYTSPQALVTLEAIGASDQVYADKDGYFEFKNRFSPVIPQDICLTAQDQFGRLTTPVCLPPFPNNYYIEIGPVIMPPTVSLNNNDFWLGDEVILTGQTIPNSEINLSIFNQKGKNNLLGKLSKYLIFPKKILAAPFPKIDTKSDTKGNFSFALPSSTVDKFTLFTQVKFNQQDSPKSRKLTVEILPWWMIIIKFLLFIFSQIKNRLLELAILTQIAFLIYYFFKHFFSPKTLTIIKYQGFQIIKKEKYPLVKNII